MALIQNKRARHDYAIEEKFEAGIVLQGWEVKSVRASRAQINLAHIYVRDGRALPLQRPHDACGPGLHARDA